MSGLGRKVLAALWMSAINYLVHVIAGIAVRVADVTVGGDGAVVESVWYRADDEVTASFDGTLGALLVSVGRKSAYCCRSRTLIKRPGICERAGARGRYVQCGHRHERKAQGHHDSSRFHRSAIGRSSIIFSSS